MHKALALQSRRDCGRVVNAVDMIETQELHMSDGPLLKVVCGGVGGPQ